MDSLKSSGGPELSTQQERRPFAVLLSDQELTAIFCSFIAHSLLIRSRGGNSSSIALAANVIVVTADYANAACAHIFIACMHGFFFISSTLMGAFVIAQLISTIAAR
ncbi:hypothetical protein L227DRAFT_617103 [Lentinus tigrinus ALCF2SS1-6]|uniref:Uncharacterized protein n=1 Tax=Lentinus tigrinus ALCF2SS1-6 TaxID=1328759 RepID=A0A5C2RQB4_9APHY|nr:hypothetical protein L227DRAFT_617103 [Lentinus tigrinus ALCF2SS1-6]